MTRSPHRMRHWKQRFDKGADFTWRRNTVYAGEQYYAGDRIPQDLKDKPTKLRRFWESKWIQLADFDAPDVVMGCIVEYQKVEETEPENEKDEDKDKKVEEESSEDDSWLDGDEVDEG